MTETIVVTGGVAGGASFAARARRLNESATIVMIERGEHISFANCGLPYFVSGEIQRRDKLLVETAEHFARRFRVDVRVRNEVLSIDREKKTVEVLDHRTSRTYRQPYEKLVLSPGAEPVRPPLPGMDNPKIFSLRTIEDAEKIRGCIEQTDPQEAVVVGGGFIGLEMVENLSHLGIHVSLVEMADQVMLSLDPEMSEWIHQHLRLNGVELVLGSPVESFHENGEHQLVVTVRGGRQIPCDMVISAIGVKPEVELARRAGLEVGERGGIRVNEHLQTTDESIYAIGDAIETEDRVLGGLRLTPLAGIANKQGRLAADHIFGKDVSFPGAFGTNIVRIFDLSVASAGANERGLKARGIAYRKSFTHPASHAGYYPGATPMVMKLLFAPDDGRILGAQIVGIDGVDKRIDVLATALHAGMTVFDLTRLELSYAPQYGTGKDAVNIAGYAASNIVQGDVEVFYAEDLDQLIEKGGFLLDVRTEREFRRGHIEGAVNIPIDEIRDRLDELPRGRTLFVYCLTGIRSYYVCRILKQLGYNVLNFSGGYMVYCAESPAKCKEIPGLHRWKRILALETFCSTPEERNIVRNRKESVD
ncbi:MAG: FAD-dependent oxidoreductase [Planctomycetota bacterium]|nr:FAD-dependent oxidoreductase [Planctomycetota bacterium]